MGWQQSQTNSLREAKVASWPATSGSFAMGTGYHGKREEKTCGKSSEQQILKVEFKIKEQLKFGKKQHTNWMQVFNVLDAFDDGYLGLEDFLTATDHIGLDLDGEDVKVSFKELCTNNDQHLP